MVLTAYDDGAVSSPGDHDDGYVLPDHVCRCQGTRVIGDLYARKRQGLRPIRCDHIDVGQDVVHQSLALRVIVWNDRRIQDRRDADRSRPAYSAFEGVEGGLDLRQQQACRVDEVGRPIDVRGPDRSIGPQIQGDGDLAIAV